MSEVNRKQIYIVIGSKLFTPEGDGGRGALQLLVTELAVKGFKVNARDADMLPVIPFVPCPAIFIEHAAGVPIQLGASSAQTPPLAHEIRVRPPVPKSLISYAHPLQISVIGEPNTGKTVLTNLIAQILQVTEPTFFSLDHPHIQVWDVSQVNDLIPNLKDRIEIHIRYLPVSAIGDLGKLF